MPDHFALFGLPRASGSICRTSTPATATSRRRFIRTSFAHAGDAERRLSMQWATQVNEAYQTLKNPLERAQYLLHLAGHDIAGGNQYRDAGRFPDGADGVARGGRRGARAAAIATSWSICTIACAAISTAATSSLAICSMSRRFCAARIDRVRRLMFLEKLLDEIDDALASLEE